MLFSVDRHLSLVLWIGWKCRQDRCPRKETPNGDSAGQPMIQNRYGMEYVAEYTLADHLRMFYAEVKTVNTW